ncbi:MAG TPA: hypothetical protein VGE30_02885 [Candidatus Saccharimonadales bacterium]
MSREVLDAPATQYEAEIGQLDEYTRKYNDAATWFAEVLNGSMRTPFEYRYVDDELYAEDGGALGPIFDDAIEAARHIDQETPALGFELRRRLKEQDEYVGMIAMMRGDAPNTKIVLSDFPAELMNASEDIGGYNVTRKPAMLRVLVKQAGRLKMFSQTLDGSDREALTAIYRYFNREPEEGELLGQHIDVNLDEYEQELLTDRLTGIYDQSLKDRHGGEWYAGRQEMPHDTYTFVLQQRDILEHCVKQELVGRMTRNDLYDAAALMNKRFEGFKQLDVSINVEPEEVIASYVASSSFQRQMLIAGDEARAAGITFTGCGISAQARGTEQQLTDAGYGNQSEDGENKPDGEEDEFGPLVFECKNHHINRRKKGEFIKKCHFMGCKNSVAC